MSFHSRAALGAIDQAITAAGHFLLGVMVARLGGVEALGSFAFAYAVIVMANMLHGAVLGEIYSVSDAARAGQRESGPGFLLAPTLVMALGMFVIALPLLFIGEQASAIGSLSFGGALVMSMFLWSVKVYLYCHGSPRQVLLCSALYVAIMLGTTFGCYRVYGPEASPFTGIAVGAAVALLVVAPAIRGIAWWTDSMKSFVGAIARYAKWSVPAAGLIWLANNGYYLLMPANSDVRQAAGLRAILNLLVPFNTLLVGASAALLPVLASIHREQGREGLARATHRMAGAILVGAGLFALVMAMVSGRVLGLIYGSEFASFATALQVASLLPALWGVAVVYRTSIRAMGESFDLFKVYFFALFPCGIALMVMLSSKGAAQAVIGVAITQLLVVAGFIYRFVAMTGERHEVQLRQG